MYDPTSERVWLAVLATLFILQFGGPTLGEQAAFALFISPLVAVALFFFLVKER